MKKRLNKQKIVPIFFDNYISLIKNSVGAKMWRNFYAKVEGKKRDLVKGGDLSCAYFVSSILYLFNLIKSPHLTVASTIEDMMDSGWIRINKPKIGSVLVWEEKFSKNSGSHRHIGFYIGKNKAVSNSSKKRKISQHHWTFGKKQSIARRKVDVILWHPKLSA
jgi:hypothetical protein